MPRLTAPVSKTHTLSFCLPRPRRRPAPVLLVAVLLLASALPAAAPTRGQQVVASFIAHFKRLCALHDLRCQSQITLQVGKDKLSQVLRVALQRPDKLRMDVLASNLPMIAGWTYIRNGDRLLAYDPLSERTVSLNLLELTERHPMRLDSTFSLPAGLFDPDQFVITYQGRRREGGRTWEVVSLRPRQVLHFHGQALARLEFLLQPSTLLPQAETAWDRHGHKVLAATFSEPATVAPGLVANLRMDLVQRRGGRGTIRFRWVDHALLPVSMEFWQSDHQLRMTVQHTGFVVDRGIPDREFILP